jgi:hypothetical protein
MALLASRNQTVSARTRWVVDYSDWLCNTTLATWALVSSSTTAAVDAGAFNPEQTQVIFFVIGGVLNETFTVTLTVSDSLGQIRIDTINFTVVAP